MYHQGTYHSIKEFIHMTTGYKRPTAKLVQFVLDRPKASNRVLAHIQGVRPADIQHIRENGLALYPELRCNPKRYFSA